MRWTKVKSLIEERFAESIRKRMTINSARYGSCTCGRAWLTFDKEEIANFCTRAYYNKDAEVHTPSEESEKKFAKMPVEYGELSRQDAYEACWAFLHDLSIEEALEDDDPLIQTLAVLDARIGKRRLAKFDKSHFHPLARKCLELRIAAEET